MLAAVEHCVVLDARTDDVISCLNQTRNRQVVAFGSTAGEHNFRSPATEQSSHRVSRPFHCGPRLLPMLVDGRCVAEGLPEVGPHGLNYVRQHRSAGVVVEINPTHAVHTIYFTLLSHISAQHVVPLKSNGALQGRHAATIKTVNYRLPFMAYRYRLSIGT